MSVIGELLLRIGVDPAAWSQLQGTLDQGESDIKDFAAAAEAAGQDLDTGLSAAASSAAESLSSLAAAMDPVAQAQADLRAAFASTGVDMGDAAASSSALGEALKEMGVDFGDAAEKADDSKASIESYVSSIGDLIAEQATLQETFNQAQAVAEGAQAAYDAGAVSAGTLQAALQQLEDAETALHGKTEEVTSGFEGFGESLAKMAEFAGVAITLESIAEAVKDVARESIEAFGNLQMVTAGLTALTGSAEGAQNILESMKELASGTIFSFPDLADAAQRMAAIGVSAEQIPGAMNAIADSAEATGRGLDAVSSAFDRIFLSGTVNARGLSQLGISMDDLANVMGIDADKVTKALKGMGAESQDTLDVLVAAMRSKTAEAADAISETLPVAINSLKAEWDELLEEFGKDVSPGFISVIGAIKEGLPYIEKFAAALSTAEIDQWVLFGTALSNLNSGLSGLAGSLPNLTVSFSDLGISVGSFINGLTHIQDVTNIIVAVNALLDHWGVTQKDLNTQLDKTRAGVQDYSRSLIDNEMAELAAQKAAALHQAALDGLAKSMKEVLTVSDITTQDPFSVIEGALQRIQTDAPLSATALIKASGEWQNAFDKFIGEIKDFPETMDQFSTALENGFKPEAAEKKLQDLITAFQNTDAASTQAGKDLIADMQASLQALQDLASSDLWDQYGQKLQEIGDQIQKSMGAPAIAAFNAFEQKLQHMPIVFDPLTKALQDLGVESTKTFSDASKYITDFDTVLNSAGASSNDLDEAWKKFNSDIGKFGADSTTALTALVNEATAYAAKLSESGGSWKQILDLEQTAAQDQLKLDQLVGATADVTLVHAENLAKVNEQLNLAKSNTMDLANLYTNMLTEFNAAWTQLGTGIGDAIVSGQNFGKAMTTVLDDMEKKLSELVVNYLLGELKKAFQENIDILGVFSKAFNAVFGVKTSAGGASDGLESLPTETNQAGISAQDGNSIATGVGDVQQGVQTVSSTLSNLVSMFTQIAGLISDIVQGFQMAHLIEVDERVELNTRQAAMFLGSGGGVIDHLHVMLTQVGELNSGFQGWFHDAFATHMQTVENIDVNLATLVNLAASGALGGGGGGPGAGPNQVPPIETAPFTFALGNTSASVSNLGSSSAGTTSSVQSLGAAATQVAAAINTASSNLGTWSAQLGDTTSTQTQQAADAAAAAAFKLVGVTTGTGYTTSTQSQQAADAATAAGFKLNPISSSFASAPGGQYNQNAPFLPGPTAQEVTNAATQFANAVAALTAPSASAAAATVTAPASTPIATPVASSSTGISVASSLGTGGGGGAGMTLVFPGAVVTSMDSALKTGTTIANQIRAIAKV